MTVAVNGIAHIQLTVNDPDVSLPFWESFLNFLDMSTLIRNDETVYCIGSRTGVLVRAAPLEKRGKVFAVSDPLFQVETLLFGRNQDVPCTCCGHEIAFG